MGITEYNIISASDRTMLVLAVNEKIREGWVPLGGPYHIGPAAIGQAITRTRIEQAEQR